MVDVPHPGPRIRAEVIPRGISVTKAAEMIGVGRPALSNLLNGKAALSSDMAARLEKAFNYPRESLIDMQSKYDASQAEKKISPAEVISYVPPFLKIKANDIENWGSHNILARSRFAVFLRTLVHSTGINIKLVDFPGNDDAERPGWDGLIEAGEGTPWVPAGRSGWEFGTNEVPKTKADGDFNKSVKSLSVDEMAAMTFVFVTPRRWAGKAAWIATKRTQALWKDIRVYDASDIEQWLEQSLPAQAWFANEIHLPTENVRSLDRCWADWANVATPPLTGSLFNSAIDAGKRIILSRLSKPPESPIVIAADSVDEALAFLAQVLSGRGGDELALYRDRVLVFDQPGVLPRLATAAQTFIAVALTREVERELAPYDRILHSIVIYPRNAANTEPNIILEPANYDSFSNALKEMGKTRDEIVRLENASGRSLTVLRRQLSAVPAIRTPVWAEDRQTAESLVPFLLVGAWNSANENDRIGLSLLSGGHAYDNIEKKCQHLAQLNDAPIWSVGTYRGVISKIDLMYYISNAITKFDLENYFEMARMVLGEDDPALDLDDNRRWAAAFYRKTRDFSATFRSGISETLVLLAVHGVHLFKNRFGLDVGSEVDKVIRYLLPTPLNIRVLEANDHDLPTYAEAAPEEFISILERDLKSGNPAVLGLLRPADAGLFGRGPSRTGLLWALENLSWNSKTLPRAALILARLAEVEINDNWVNKPINSLEAIFRAWMPQTAAGHQERVKLMNKLVQKFPAVAWKICIAQFGTNHRVGNYSHKPRWRTDSYGFGEPLATREPIIDFMKEMVEAALSWSHYSVEMLCDLVERLSTIEITDQARVWSLIETWANREASDSDKAIVREKIRTTIMSRRALSQIKKNAKAAALANAAKAAYTALEPSDIINKYAWLFRESWVEESADELDNLEHLDFQQRATRIDKLRSEALCEILAQRGLAGILEISERSKASWVIGVLAASSVMSMKEIQSLLHLALNAILTGQEDVHSFKNLIGGALRSLGIEKREALFEAMASSLSEENMVQLFLLAPFGRSTWKLIDALAEPAQAKYWGAVTPDWTHDSDAENNEAVERLLKVERPRAAFSCIRLQPQIVDAYTLFRLLSAMAKGGNDSAGEYRLEHYNVEEAFKHLNISPALTLDQKAGLEFAYIDVLARSWDDNAGYRIPNLERYIEAHPELFVQAVAWTYKRKDGATDPADLQVPAEQTTAMAERGYKLLEAVKRIPGHDDLGELRGDRLAAWIAVVRQSCAELGRADVADGCIGKLLSGAPVGDDGVWPCEPVRDVMEDVQSDILMNGAHAGVYNARGVHWRGDGGSQEYALAEKYSKWGRALQVSHPFVASKLLMALARTYEQEASREDTEAGIRRRLH